MLKKWFYAVLLTTASFGLVNCAQSSGGGGGSKVASTPNCTSGQVSTQYGCLPINQQCGPNFGYHQTHGCVPGNASINCQSGCPSGQVRTVLGTCMKAATQSQLASCGGQFTCAGWGPQYQGGPATCVAGVDQGNYYGNQNPYQNQYGGGYQNYYNPYQYYYQPYSYGYPYGYGGGGGNAGLYFYFGF